MMGSGSKLISMFPVCESMHAWEILEGSADIDCCTADKHARGEISHATNLVAAAAAASQLL